jgi:hypothetical protein
MRRILFQFRVFLRAGVIMALSAYCTISYSSSLLPKPIKYANDPRFHRLKVFFGKHQLPAADQAGDFLEAAERHDLDWRLLPSLAMIESTGGKYSIGNNMFGWDYGLTDFTTPAAGIHHVGERLANGDLYRGKDLLGKLRTYNPRHHYARAVLQVMRSLEIVPATGTVRSLSTAPAM